MRYYVNFDSSINKERWERFLETRDCPNCGNDHIHWTRNSTLRSQGYRGKAKEWFFYRAKCHKCNTSWQTPFVETID